MRLGCLLVSFAVLASLVLEPPRAKAEALTLAAVGGTALVAAYLGACGMMPYTTGMDRNGVNESVARMIQDFLDDTFSGGDEPSGGGNKPSLNDWLGMITFAVLNGVVRFGKEAADKLNQFAQWVAGKYGTKPGVNQVYSTNGLFSFRAEGFIQSTPSVGNAVIDFPLTVTAFPSSSSIKVYYITATISLDPGTYEFRFFTSDGVTGDSNCFVLSNYSNLSIRPSDYVSLGEGISGFRATFSESFSVLLYFKPLFEQAGYPSFTLPIDISRCWIKRLDKEESSFGLDVSDTMQQVLDRLTALEEGQSIALDVGAAQSMEIQDILQGILDAILAGDLAASAEIVDEAVKPVDPAPPPVVPVVPEGLDKLGAALTSRFPFSIPWDVYKGVTLLAAPPKAPYFEVDFMAPIAYRVGGWKGSTKIVLDMSEYEIIGQVCRWTSTIGFCLMLATGTKRLIWTA